MTTPTLVAPLRGFGRGDILRAGGKGANLGELIRRGLPVPDGFVVTTDAYASIEVPTHDRTSYEAVRMPEPLAAAIADAYATLGGGAVAVRSSATAEDLPGAAFAGQQDTYLNVVGEVALLDAVRRCWGSLWTERAIVYRERLRIDPADVRIAVVVQRMVDADAAGVMFTADPVTGARDEIVVEASAGLGEAVVSGLVTPDRYVLSRDGAVRRFTPGRREVVVRAAAAGGIVHEDGEVAASTANGASHLSNPQLAELARRGAEIAEHFGRPQDVEWAVASGRVWLLQARPMTALPPPPIRGRLNPLRRRLSGVLLEFLPSRPYPMDMSTWVPHGPAGLMAKLTASIGLRGAFEGFLLEEDGVVTRFVPPRPRPTPRILLAPFLVASRARRHDPARWQRDPRYLRYRESVREFAARDLGGMEWRALIRMPREALALVEPVTDLRIDYLPGSGVALVRLAVALKLSRGRRASRDLRLGDLLLDGRSRTEQANRDLEALAAVVRADPGLARRVAEEDPVALVPVMASVSQFRTLIAEHGHRETASPLLATSPTWGEAPEVVVGLVKVLLAAPSGAVRPGARPKLEGLSPRLRRRIERARVGAAFREDTHYEFTRPLPLLRASLLEIGHRLTAAGALDRADDVWHLRLEELEALSSPDAAAAGDLRQRVVARSARREELSGTRLIDPRAVFPQRDAGDAIVAGEPASGGQATGPVRIVRDPAEFGRVEPGDILVCPYTNPSWTPLFQRAAAVVVDSGGIGSHAAIVAREYGIPAIMGTAVGTSSLREGQRVTVDGDTGRVTTAESGL